MSRPNAFDMGTWHTCNTTHCRAGWAVTIAGEAGAALESFYNTELAAMLIYDASDPDYRINPARFYDSNTDALTDMRRLAERAPQPEPATGAAPSVPTPASTEVT